MPRTVGSYQKRTFLDTNLGRFIYLVEPLIFSVICPTNKQGFAPDIHLISIICEKSDNDSFKTQRFSKYLEEYRNNGLRVKRKKKITPEIEAHYKSIRDRRLKNKIKNL